MTEQPPTKEIFVQGKPATSDVQPGLTKDLTPESKAFRERMAKLEVAVKKFETNIKTLEKELGVIDWCYPINEEHPYKVSELAQTILNRISNNECSIITDKNSQNLYFYNQASGFYHKDGELFLRVLIDKVLGLESSPHRINETVELTKIKTYAIITPSKKIAVENGLLDVETLTLEPFSKYEFVTNKLNAAYKPGAKSESWEKFIDQVCPDDKALLQEWSGYLLVKGYPFHTIMWLFGPTGRNGKGTWARTMEGILGEENYSAVAIDEFDGKHRFAVFNLHDSLFNICSEPRTDRILTIEMLQMLSGKDAIDAEIKGVQKRFKFKNPAKLTIMGNKFPNIDKPTDAFWDRLELCKFPFRFVDEKQIQDIENLWLNDPEQRSGILNWMLDGKVCLFEKIRNPDGTEHLHGFTKTKTQKEAIIQFKRASDSIGAFIVEAIEFGPDFITLKTEAQERYKNYCEEIGVTNENARDFADRLRDTLRIKDTSTRILDKKTKVWGGIKLKPTEAEMEELTEQKRIDEFNKSEAAKAKLAEEAKKTTKAVKSGTSGTSGTPFTPAKIGDLEYLVGIEGHLEVPKVPTVPEQPSDSEKLGSGDKPLLKIYKVFHGEPCCCGLYAVEYELHDTVENTRKRVCLDCAKPEKKWFVEHGYNLESTGRADDQSGDYAQHGEEPSQ